MYLMLTSPWMRKPEVGAVQEMLRTLKFYTGTVDSVFGPKTHDAVVQYQEARHLEADGVVGPKTLESLSRDVEARENPLPSTDGLSLDDAMVSIAKLQIGVTETPPGSNIQKYGAWFGWNGLPWCAIFCSWVFHKASGGLRWLFDWIPKAERKKYRGLFRFAGGASCPSLMEACEVAGVLFYPKDGPPEKADLVFFQLDKDEPADHIGVCSSISTKPDGTVTVYVIEGNAPSAVHHRSYALTDKRLLAFGRVKNTTPAAE